MLGTSFCICCNWTKASTVAGIAKMLEEKKGNGIHHYVAANASDPAQCKFTLSQVLQLENILEFRSSSFNCL
jgi:hypothetical protein